MARLKAKTIDRNRLAKKYPFVRAPKRISIIADQDLIVELVSLTFNNESQKTGFFETPYKDTQYRAAISPRDDTASDSANVNLFIVDSLSDASKITVGASARFTGVVDVIIIRIGA